MPAILLFIATIIVVLPCSSKSCKFFSISFMSIPFSSINFLFPNKISCPRYLAFTPLPVIELNSSASGISIPLSFAPLTIASPNGCSDLFSTIAASFKTSFGLLSLRERTSVNSGSPLVSVPVLSKTTVSILCASCKDRALLIRMPFCAPIPVPTITAVGVAKPRAQGQAIIKTAMNIVRANMKLWPVNNHKRNAPSPITKTMGTKWAEILSASSWMGAFDP